MSKTLSATPKREPVRACRGGAPSDFSETLIADRCPEPIARTPRIGVGTARQRGSSPRVMSNLEQPAGVLSWERDFLLALAVDVLEDFVGNTNEEDE
jgi:hypothetical protein